MEHVWGEHVTNTLSSVAFWYQQQPLLSREPLPAGDANHGRPHSLPTAAVNPAEVDVPALEVSLRERGYSVRTVVTLGQQWLDGGGLVVDTGDEVVEITIPVVADGHYRVEIKPVYGLINGPLTFGLLGQQAVMISPETLVRDNDGSFVTLGNADSEAGQIRLVAESSAPVPLHRVQLTKMD